MKMLSHLTSGINVSLLRDDARRRLLDCLDKCSGTKAIIWDEDLIGPIGLIAEYALLKEHNVIKMFHLHSERHQKSDVQNIIFLVRGKLKLMDLIADYILKEDRDKQTKKKDYHIFFVPRKCFLCETKLKDRGVYGNFRNIDDYAVDLFPVDSDVLSLELPETFKECHVEGVMTNMLNVARALVTMQFLYGVIPNVYGKGKCAKQVFDLMARIRREQAGNEPQVPPKIDNLILLDRSVDLLTPLATQLTYEGLIDHFFGIENNSSKVPPEKFGSEDTDLATGEICTEFKQIALSSADELYSELRDKNFNAVGPILSKKAKQLSSQFDERHGAKSVSEIKQFVGRLPQLQASKKSLAMHTAIAELIKERTDSEEFLEGLQLEQEFMNGLETDKINSYIDDCIAKQEKILKVLRLICIQSVINGGLKQKAFDYYRREILQTYGFRHLLTLSNLEQAGLLKVQGSKTFSTIKKTLRLLVEDVNEQKPTDIAYVHSVYAPLSIRLVQFVTQPGWRAITDILNILPGPTVEEKQIIPMGLRRRRGSGSSIQSSLEEQRTSLVVFLGGCTFAEIAALRFLSQQDDAPMEYFVMTTSIINGNTFLSSLFENLEGKNP